jgi:hypothetical protein
VNTDLAGVMVVGGIVTIGLANVANAANGMDEAAVLTPASESVRFTSATTDPHPAPSKSQIQWQSLEHRAVR